MEEVLYVCHTPYDEELTIELLEETFPMLESLSTETAIQLITDHAGVNNLEVFEIRGRVAATENGYIVCLTQSELDSLEEGFMEI